MKHTSDTPNNLDVLKNDPLKMQPDVDVEHKCLAKTTVDEVNDELSTVYVCLLKKLCFFSSFV